MFLEIVQGIDYLHGKGIVHGDLKPENVMIEGEYRRPETWHTKLTDFGTVGLIAHPVVIDGRTVTLADITCPILYFVGETDEIARAGSVRAIRDAAPASDVPSWAATGPSALRSSRRGTLPRTP